jgi:hypothetical protein
LALILGVIGCENSPTVPPPTMITLTPPSFDKAMLVVACLGALHGGDKISDDMQKRGIGTADKIIDYDLFTHLIDQGVYAIVNSIVAFGPNYVPPTTVPFFTIHPAPVYKSQLDTDTGYQAYLNALGQNNNPQLFTDLELRGLWAKAEGNTIWFHLDRLHEWIAAGIYSIQNNYLVLGPQPINPAQQIVTPQAQDAINKVISAMNQVKSFNLESEVTETHSGTLNQPVQSNFETFYEWKGTKSIDVSNHAMQVDITVNTNSTSMVNKDTTAFQMYFLNGWEYYNITIPSSYSGWKKTHQYDDWWDPELQIPDLVELLNSINVANVDAFERIEGIGYLVLNATLSRPAISTWVLSQHQIVGPGKVSAGSITKYNDEASYGTMKIWISQTDYTVKRVTMSALLSGKMHVGSVDVGSPAVSDNDISIVDTVYGELIFSNYNQKISVQLPTEALSAVEH